MNIFSKNGPIGGARERTSVSARRSLSTVILGLLFAASASFSHGQTFDVLSNFGPDNWIPMYSLIQGPDGGLYGTTNRNGNADGTGGTLFKFSLTDNTLSSLYTFC